MTPPSAGRARAYKFSALVDRDLWEDEDGREGPYLLDSLNEAAGKNFVSGGPCPSGATYIWFFSSIEKADRAMDGLLKFPGILLVTRTEVPGREDEKDE